MKRQRLVLGSPMIATTAAAGFLAAALVSGSLTAETAQAKKGDRFEVVGEELCSGQAWPNITAECVAWRNGAPETADKVRYLTIERTDRAARVTELERVAVPAD